MELTCATTSNPQTYEATFIDELYEVLQPSYVDPTALVKREAQRCNACYHLRDENDTLVAFFMVEWHTLDVGDTSQPAVYLGLSATRQDMKGSGQVRRVYQHFLRDAIAWEQRTGDKLMLWFTTATPSAYHAARRLFEDLEPRADGSYTSQRKRLAVALRDHLGVDRPDHPFVLRGTASDTLYSDQEAERIQRVCTSRGFTLFDELGIIERNGDRLLCICHAPQT